MKYNIAATITTMTTITIIILTTFLLFMPLACGSGGDAPNQKEERTGKNELSVSFNQNELNNPGDFQLKSTKAFISGMRYNAKATAKLVYVVFANYPVKISIYGAIEPPRSEGQIVIEMAFKTDNVEIPIARQMEEYAKLQVPTGVFKPTWMGENRSFQLSYWVANKNGIGISGDGASGSATLTASTPEFVSGTIDFTSEKGSTIKGSFNVKIEKDFWKR